MLFNVEKGNNLMLTRPTPVGTLETAFDLYIVWGQTCWAGKCL